MKNTIIALSILAALAFTQCTNNAPAADTDATAAPTEETLTQRGEYLVGILGCHDCHSPKKMGPQGPELIPELMLSGYPADRPFGKVNKEVLADGWALFNGDLTAGIGPWGATFAANITSDASGIGEWSLEQFTRALTQGKAKGMEDGPPLVAAHALVQLHQHETGRHRSHLHLPAKHQAGAQRGARADRAEGVVIAIRTADNCRKSEIDKNRSAACNSSKLNQTLLC